MKIALHFGAGNIGRGFIGQIINQSNYKVVFVDVNKEIISLLSKEKQYQIEIVGNNKKTITINNIDAINSGSEEIKKIIDFVEIITTAVGPNILKNIANEIANAIKYKYQIKSEKHLNIIACENMINGSDHLKIEILKYLDQDEANYLEKYIGFPNAAVDRIVPPSLSKEISSKVVVEEFFEWIVDKSAFKGELAKIDGMILTDNLFAFIERKLFTLNTGHSSAAYLGCLKGHETIIESIKDKEIRERVINIMKESGEVLIKRHNFNRDEHFQYIEKIIARFENPYLKDSNIRVAREPLRKLSPNERLIKPLLGTLEYNLPNENLIYTIASAYAYKNKDDTQAKELEEEISKIGIFETIKKISKIGNENIENKIAKIYEDIINNS